jgi:peptidase M50-like protein
VAENQASPVESPIAESAVGHAPASEMVRTEIAERPARAWPRLWVVLPIVLFLLTCLSTFLAGATGWRPFDLLLQGAASGLDPYGGPWIELPVRLAILENWQGGLIYMACVVAILLTHEMGHFVMTVIYRVRATLPLFIPLPISAIGTMGAVIAMDGRRADRRQIFDIGLAGPLAGLAVAIPIVWIGAAQLDLSQPAEGLKFGLPLAVRWLVQWLHPDAGGAALAIGMNQLNPYFMAGWVGLLVTGLNMMPVSQLDGGHVTYALFGRRAHWLARMFMVVVCLYMGIKVWLDRMPPAWMLMAVLVLAMGTDHPPTRDDTVRLGWFRIILGALSLLIPILCFAPNLVQV